MLINLVWEDILYYLSNIDKLTEDDQKEIINLLIGMIEASNVFLENRIKESIQFILKIKYNKKKLINVLLKNFKNIKQLL